MICSLSAKEDKIKYKFSTHSSLRYFTGLLNDRPWLDEYSSHSYNKVARFSQ